MANLIPTSAFANFAKEWEGLTLRESALSELVSLACVLGQEVAFKTAFKRTFGKTPPNPNEMKKIKGGYAIWSGQGQYLLLLSGENVEADLDIAEKLSGTAYVTLQSDGWASLEILGLKTHAVLERFIPLDLRRAPINYAARTSAHHIAVIVLKLGETHIQCLTPRTSAQSFLDGAVHTADNVLS